MYQNQPWTVDTEEPLKEKENSRDNNGNAFEAVSSFLNKHSNKIFTTKEIAEATKYQKTIVTLALKNLLAHKDVKIVKFSKSQSSGLIPHYQSKKGNFVPLKIIEADNKEKIIALTSFIKNEDIKDTVYFRYEVQRSNLREYYLKSKNGTYFIGYKYCDLMKIYKGIGGCLKTWSYSFQFFGFELNISIKRALK